MHRISSFALVICLASPAAFGQNKLPTSVFLEMVEGQMLKQCEESRAQAPTAATDREKGTARAGVLMQCECMPGELKAVKERADLPGEITQEEAMTLIQTPIERCTGRALRQMLVEDCPLPENKEEGVKDQKAYCGCLVGKVEKLSDAEIGSQALAANENYQKRVAAAGGGEAQPAKSESIMDRINNECRAEQGLSPKP